MPSTQNAVNNHEYRSVPITALAESATNPRKRFGAKSLEELASSFKTQGILAPLLVRELEESKYEVVAGARRLRAAKLAELEKLPVRVVKLTDAEAIEAQCVELSVVGKKFLLIRGSARRLHLNDVPTPTFS
jgi:ParB family chromosome partitioning protein